MPVLEPWARRARRPGGARGDSLAALLDAIAVIRDRLDASGLRWAWPDGKEWDTGIPLLSPVCSIPKYRDTIEQSIRVIQARRGLLAATEWCPWRCQNARRAKRGRSATIPFRWLEGVFETLAQA